MTYTLHLQKTNHRMVINVNRHGHTESIAFEQDAPFTVPKTGDRLTIGNIPEFSHDDLQIDLVIRNMTLHGGMVTAKVTGVTHSLKAENGYFHHDVNVHAVHEDPTR